MVAELSLECKLARDYAMVNMGDTLCYLLMKIIPNPSAEFVSVPLNIGLVIDVSRSMNGRKLKYAIEATRQIISALHDQDWISIITFSDKARIIVPSVQVRDKATLMEAVNKIKTISSTRMFHGMQASDIELRKPGLQNKVNRMILLTDGETEGEEQCRIIANQEKQNSIMITAVGIGKDYNENLLSDIADITLGRFAHLKAPEQITDIFKQELEMSAASVISDVYMDLSLGKGIRLESLDRVFPNSVRLQPVSEADGKVLKVGLGNLMKEDPTIIGAQLKLPPSSAGKIKIVGIHLRYALPDPEKTVGMVNQDIFVRYTDKQELCSQVDREVISYFNQINAQNLIEEAIRQTRIGNINEATKSLSRAEAITEKLGNLPLTKEINEALDELEAKGLLSSDSIKTIKAGSRHTIHVKKSDIK